MRIYFCGSIRGGRHLQPLYARVVHHLEAGGHQVLTRHVAEPGVLEWEAVRRMTPRDIYARDVAWLKECDLVIAEVTVPSLGVGVEIATAQHLGKPIVCLCREGTSLSAMVAGNPGVQVLTYQGEEDLLRCVDRALGARPA